MVIGGLGIWVVDAALGASYRKRARNAVLARRDLCSTIDHVEIDIEVSQVYKLEVDSWFK